MTIGCIIKYNSLNSYTLHCVRYLGVLLKAATNFIVNQLDIGILVFTNTDANEMGSGDANNHTSGTGDPMCVNYITHISSKIYDKSHKS